MFIDVTRYAGGRTLRLAVSAIAYLDDVEGGCAVHLLGGETLRVGEDRAEIERRIEALYIAVISPAAEPIDSDKEIAAAGVLEDAGIFTAADVVDVKVNALRQRGKRA